VSAPAEVPALNEIMFGNRVASLAGILILSAYVGADARHKRKDQSMHRNPFNVVDVPEPNDHDVKEFAASARLDAHTDDDNANAWAVASNRPSSVEGL
jgi:hypothetical protein